MAVRLCWAVAGLKFLFRSSPKVQLCSSVRISSLKREGNDCIVITEDGSTVVCWHPEEPFPYECSRPLPEVAEETQCVLNDNSNLSGISKPKSEEVVRQELMKLTHTTKHRWFPRSRDKYLKQRLTDREYL